MCKFAEKDVFFWGGGILIFCPVLILSKKNPFSPHFHQEIFPFESIFCVGFLVGVAHGIAQQQVLFA